MAWRPSGTGPVVFLLMFFEVQKVKYKKSQSFAGSTMYLPRLIAGDMSCTDRDRFGDVPILQAGLSNRRFSSPMRS